MASRNHRRWRKAVLRGSRQRHAAHLRARVRRRLPQLGAADAVLLALLPLHRVQRARLSALGRAGGSGEVLAGARARRHPRRARSPARHRQGACLRPVDGRLRDAAFRHVLRRARAVARGRPAAATAPSPPSASSSARRPTPLPTRSRSDGMAKVAKRYSLGPTRVQFQNKDPRGWAEFAAQLAEHSTRARRSPCAACRRAGLRCGSWPTA